MPTKTSRRLTVYFDGQFWVGLIEIEGPRDYRVARHVFGAEPTEPEVALFVLSDWSRLRFTDDKTQASDAISTRKVGYKRMLRQSKRELEKLEKQPFSGTAAQKALQEQREQTARERKSSASERKAESAQAAYEQRKAKQKARHRGK